MKEYLVKHCYTTIEVVGIRAESADEALELVRDQGRGLIVSTSSESVSWKVSLDDRAE